VPDARWETSLTRLRSLALNVALALASLTVCLLGLEGSARLLARHARAELAESGPPIARHHPRWGWEKVPGVAKRIRREEYDIEIAMNSRGLRGPERDYQKPEGVGRILLLGDSFTQGYYVEEEDSARARLEGALAARACGQWEVLNGGTPGYSTDQELLYYEDELARYGADVVVLMLYYNDLFFNVQHVGTRGLNKPVFQPVDGELELTNVPVPEPRRERTPVPRPIPTWRGSAALEMLSARTGRSSPRLHRLLARLGLVSPLSLDPPRELWPFCALGSEEEAAVEEMWERTDLILQALNRAVKERGGELVLVYVPAIFEIDESAWEYLNDRYHPARSFFRNRVADRVRRLSRAQGVRVVDPRAAMRGAASSGRAPYFRWDGHWNEVGNEVVALQLADALSADLRASSRVLLHLEPGLRVLPIGPYTPP